jgi:hypothetical protein
LTDINTPDAVLQETKALMTFDRNSGSEVQYLFDPEGAESEAYPRGIQLSTLAWLEMGRPNEVTVSVMPGDHLDHDHYRQAPGGFAAWIARTIGGLVGIAVILLIIGAVAAGAMALLLALRTLSQALLGS